MTPEEEAAELLPCLWATATEPCHVSWQCVNCKQRPAVAERLRQRDEIIREFESKESDYIKKLMEQRTRNEERIAALERRLERWQHAAHEGCSSDGNGYLLCKPASPGDFARVIHRIAALESENKLLVQEAIVLRDRLRAALAGRSK